MISDLDKTRIAEAIRAVKPREKFFRHRSRP
jgi:hypothetical protein